MGIIADRLEETWEKTHWTPRITRMIALTRDGTVVWERKQRGSARQCFITRDPEGISWELSCYDPGTTTKNGSPVTPGLNLSHAFSRDRDSEGYIVYAAEAASRMVAELVAELHHQVAQACGGRPA